MTNPESTQEIFEAFKQKNWSFLQGLVKEYTEMLLKGALSLGFRDQQADDLVQSTWTTFFDVIPTFKEKSQIKTFLYGIMLNKARELRRENTKNQNHDAIEDIVENRFHENGSWITPPISPDRFIEATQNLKAIQECLERLSTNQRAAFCLREIEGLEFIDICKVIDVSDTNLSVLLFRAKNRLRECVERKIGS